MKLSFRSKLIARATPGLRVRRLRPMAESASALIMPPWTNPAWLAMSSEGVISRVAAPSSIATSRMPSQAQAREPVRISLFTTLALRQGHDRRGVRELGDHASLDDTATVPVLGAGDQL